MKTYVGTRTRQGCSVNVYVHDNGLKQAYVLPPRHDIYNHSPDGFEWGYGGSGPSQLALAMLVDACGDTSVLPYQTFKEQIIAHLPKEGFILTSTDISVWLKHHNQTETP